MNKPILNREAKLPADGWYEIETPGEHFNAAADVVQQLDAEAFTSIVNRFQTLAAKPNFSGLLIDRDHFSLDTDKTSEAFGWLMEVRNRDGRLEGKVDWSDEGERAVKGRRFKFFSTVYDPKHAAKLGTRRIGNRDVPLMRPLELDRLALTNDPNNKGGKPISNRDGKSAAAAEPTTQPTMKNILKLLELSDDASEESAVTVLQKIKNRATTAESSVATLTTERDGLLAAQVEADLEKYQNRFKPEHREKVKAQLLKNRVATLELLDLTSPVAAPGSARITNRQGAKTPTQENSAAAKTTEQQRTAAVNAYKISNRCSFQQAWEAVRAEKPELFAEETAAAE